MVFMKLIQYLSYKSIKPADFAATVGVTRPTIERYLKGSRGLSDQMKWRIADATEGMVTVADLMQPWRPKAGRAKVSRAMEPRA